MGKIAPKRVSTKGTNAADAALPDNLPLSGVRLVDCASPMLGGVDLSTWIAAHPIGPRSSTAPASPVLVTIDDETIDRIAARVAERPATASPIHARPPDALAPALLDAPEAAALLGISVEALYQRVSRHQVPGVVQIGKRRIQFHRERLLAGIERKARR
jgi:predicted DNA-binding transcriptional regulator AlpA